MQLLPTARLVDSVWMLRLCARIVGGGPKSCVLLSELTSPRAEIPAGQLKLLFRPPYTDRAENKGRTATHYPENRRLGPSVSVRISSASRSVR
jgi:hypothetical protein